MSIALQLLRDKPRQAEFENSFESLDVDPVDWRQNLDVDEIHEFLDLDLLLDDDDDY